MVAMLLTARPLARYIACVHVTLPNASLAHVICVMLTYFSELAELLCVNDISD